MEINNQVNQNDLIQIIGSQTVTIVLLENQVIKLKEMLRVKNEEGKEDKEKKK